MSIRKTIMALTLAASVISGGAAFGASWRQKKDFRNDMGSTLEVEMTYYAAQYVEQSVMEEAEKNLWTQDEAENYRYKLLQQLKLDEYIPIFIRFNNNGPALRMAPFDAQLTLIVGRNRLSPADYDRRFNFKVTDKREGFVYFPRYDEKGNPYITDRVKSVRLTMNGNVTPVTMGRTIDFMWDVKDDDPSKLLAGRAGARMELDRLIKRLENLTKEGKDLQGQLDTIQDEIRTINSRMMELQTQSEN